MKLYRKAAFDVWLSKLGWGEEEEETDKGEQQGVEDEKVRYKRGGCCVKNTLRTGGERKRREKSRQSVYLVLLLEREMQNKFLHTQTVKYYVEEEDGRLSRSFL